MELGPTGWIVVFCAAAALVAAALALAARIMLARAGEPVAEEAGLSRMESRAWRLEPNGPLVLVTHARVLADLAGVPR